MQFWTKFLGVCVALITVIGALWCVQTYFAKYEDLKNLQLIVEEKAFAKDLVSIEQRLQALQDKLRLDSLQERNWKLEDRYGKNVEKADELVKEEYRKNDFEIRLLIEKFYNKNITAPHIYQKMK